MNSFFFLNINCIRKYFALIAICLFSYSSFSQRKVSENVISTPYIGLHFGANIPGGDFADRFGYTNHLGGIIGYKTEVNLILGIEGSFMFGGNVKEPGLLNNLLDSQNSITNISGGSAEIIPMMRGFNLNGALGFVFEGTGHNPNSGIMIMGSAGYMWHKIRIESQEDVVPQLQEEYLQGYDRLTTGFNISEFIGYNFMANQGIYNFYAGFYFIQGFTYNRRTVFWDRPDYEVPLERRLDLQYGIRLSWMIPAYKRQTKEFYYN